MLIPHSLTRSVLVGFIALAPYPLLAQGPAAPADFGDLPNPTTPGAPITYATKIVDGGPWHIIKPQIFIGASVDSEGDGFPSPGANGDDTSGGPDDEDGVTLPGSIQAGTATTFKITVTNQLATPAYLHSFVDWNGDGTFVGGLESDVQTIPPGTIGAVLSTNFNVPVDAVTANPTGARFRLSTLAVDPNDPAPDGEVEDYLITILPPDLDFGDLPDSSVGASPAYATTLSNNGPRHAIISGLELGGAAPDAELDGHPDLAALGDDGSGGDDEDGFAPLTGIQAGTTVTFTHMATNLTTNDAWLHGFFDWNHDGDFLDSEEYAKVIVPSGSNKLAVSLVIDVPTGISYANSIPARLRLTSLNIVPPNGPAPDGEVEDYLLSVLPALDFGDLPDVSPGTTAGDFLTSLPDFQTTLADDGPRHLITPELVFLNDTGSADADVDLESDAHQSAGADGDNNNGDDDELLLLLALSNLQVSSGGAPDCSDVEITAEIALNHALKNDLAVDATFHTFIDWNHDGDFDDADEAWSQNVPAGFNGNLTEFVSTTFPWQGLTSWTEQWAVRSRLTTDSTIGATGYAPNGEVQDDLVTINFTISNPCPSPTLDFGDLPDTCLGSSAGNFDRGPRIPDYQTLLRENGPRHVATPDLTIANDSGSSDSDVDTESDGQPTSAADGDDTDGNNDDLHHLVALSSQSFILASPVDHSTLNLGIITSQAVHNVTGNDATFYGFIDGNRDGDFDDPGEKQTTLIPGDGSMTSAALTFNISIPWPGVLSWNETFAFRYRISSDAGLNANGPAPDGEVQDHLVTFALATADPRPQGSEFPQILDFNPISASASADLILDPQPFLPDGMGPIDEITWSLNGTILTGSPPIISAGDLAELGKGALGLTLTFVDQDDKLYRVNPWIELRDWPAYDAWALKQGLSGQESLPSLDLDGDGFSALAEFSRGSDPQDPSSVPPSHLNIQTNDTSSWLIQSYLRRSGGAPQSGGTYLADGLLYSGEASSTNLTGWPSSAIPTSNPAELPTPPPGYLWSTHRHPIATDSLFNAFLRVRINCP